MEDIRKLYLEFLEVKNHGRIAIIVDGAGGVGKTFENAMGNSENTLSIPDYKGIEIKTQRLVSKSHITLFSCAPTGPYFHEIERIKDLYRYPHSKYKNFKVLNNSVYGNIKSKIGINYQFKLGVDRLEKNKIVCL